MKIKSNTVSNIIVKLEKISKEFNDAGNILKILDNINLEVEQGKSLAIVGPSGCGKTTLLRIIGLLEVQTCGSLIINGLDTSKLSESQKNEILKKDISFVYQFHHLLPEFTALENLIIPQINSGISKVEARENGMTILKSLGLIDKMNSKPHNLSGGERQRVAIGRAISTKPKIILADEPSGNLDPQNAQMVVDLMLKMCYEINSSLILITHDSKIAQKCDNIFNLV